MTVNISKTFLQELPIRTLSKLEQTPIITLVDRLLGLNKSLKIGSKNTDEKAKIQEQIKKTDAEIDEFVYHIYNIAENERELIEETFR